MAKNAATNDPAKLNLRMPPKLYARVERDADTRGVSMNAAIIGRLEASFRREQDLVAEMAAILGGSKQAAIFRVLADTVVASGCGVDWMDDYETFNQVVDRWHQLLRGMAPPNRSQDIEKLKVALAQIDNANTPEHKRRLLLAVAANQANHSWVPQDLRDAIKEKAQELE